MIGAAGGAGGFEEVERAEDVDAGTEEGVALADGDEDGGEVADVGDVVLGEEAVEQGAVLDGPFDGDDARGEGGGCYEVEAVEGDVEIEGDDVVAGFEEEAGDPGSDAAGGAGEEYAHLG